MIQRTPRKIGSPHILWVKIASKRELVAGFMGLLITIILYFQLTKLRFFFRFVNYFSYLCGKCVLDTTKQAKYGTYRTTD